MEFSDFESLKQYVKGAISDTLDDVAIEIGADFMENATTDVYDAYSPFVYERAYSLTNLSTYDISKEGDNQVNITVNHPHGELIEYGHGYNGDHYQFPFNRDGTAWMFLRPRPFYRHTVEALRGGRLADLMRDGLNSRGLDVK